MNLSSESLSTLFAVRAGERGVCPVCQKRVLLNARREVREHREFKTRERCRGSKRLAVMGG